MFKNISIFMWVMTTGTALSMLSYVRPISLLSGIALKIFILVVSILVGDIFIKLTNVNWARCHWKDLAGLATFFILGIIIVLLGVFYSIINFLGSPYIGLIISFGGIAYYNFVIIRIKTKFKQLIALQFAY